MNERWLLLALCIPDTHEDDPDALADDLVRILNTEWPSPKDIKVGGIPGPQWLTPATLKSLRNAASLQSKAEILYSLVPGHWWTTPPNQATADVLEGIKAFGIDPDSWRGVVDPKPEATK